jgi:very-short-patch-repair endonuclease
MKPKFLPGEMPMYFGAPARIFEYARQNRGKPTPAESVLWDAIKNKKLKGYKFRRQHPIGIFIVDFYCHEMALAIEVDGKYHDENAQQEYDSNRTKLLEEAGIFELRFRNEEILNDLNAVLTKIEHIISMQNKENE